MRGISLGNAGTAKLMKTQFNARIALRTLTMKGMKSNFQMPLVAAVIVATLTTLVLLGLAQNTKVLKHQKKLCSTHFLFSLKTKDHLCFLHL